MVKELFECKSDFLYHYCRWSISNASVRDLCIWSVTLRKKLTPLSDQLEKDLRMKYINDLKSDNNEKKIYIDELHQDMNMNEYK